MHARDIRLLRRATYCIVNFLTLIAFWLLFSQLDFLGLETAMKERASDIVAVARAPFYDHGTRNRRQPQDSIVVVLITDKTVEHLQRRAGSTGQPQISYPLPYAEHRRFLGRILRQEPAGLFVDLRFAYPRGGDQVEDLLAPLAFMPSKIPILFAKGGAGDSFPEATAALKPYGTVVAWEGQAGTYPLTTGDDNEKVAAFELYAEFCLGRDVAVFCPGDRGGLRDFSAPLAVQWGSKIAVDQDVLWDVSRCPLRPDNQGFWSRLGESLRRLLPAVMPGFGFDEHAGPRCFYHLTIPAERLEEPAVARLIKGRVVFFGAMIRGIPDLVATPTMGLAPGVAFHAMAFDNLLTDGRDYVAAAPGSGFGYWLLFQIEPMVWTLVSIWIVWRRPAEAPLILETFLSHLLRWYRGVQKLRRREEMTAEERLNLDVLVLGLLLIVLFVVNDYLLRIQVTSWLGLALLYLFAREAAQLSKHPVKTTDGKEDKSCSGIGAESQSPQRPSQP